MKRRATSSTTEAALDAATSTQAMYKEEDDDPYSYFYDRTTPPDRQREQANPESSSTSSSTSSSNSAKSAIHYVIDDESSRLPEGSSSESGTSTSTTTSASTSTSCTTSSCIKRSREGHLLVLLPLTQSVQPQEQRVIQGEDVQLTQDVRPRPQEEQRELLEFRVYVELAAFLAHQHIQHRSGLVLPDVQRRLKEQPCDFSWTYQHYDTQFSPFRAIGGLLNSSSSRTDPAASVTQRRIIDKPPFALLGAARSVVSDTLAMLGAAMNLPQISSSSTASALDEAPLFARTIASNKGDAHALMAYLRFQLDIDAFGLLFLDDAWGRHYQKDLNDYANLYNVTMKHSVPYIDTNPHNLDIALQQVQDSQLRYWIGILHPNEWKPVVRGLHRRGLMGLMKNDDDDNDNDSNSNSTYNHNQWFLGDLLELRGDSFALDASTEGDIARALHGIGMPFMQLPPHEAFDRAMASVATDTQLQQAFIRHHAEPHLFDNFTFSSNPGRSIFSYLTYDAVVSLGITACETPGLFTGQEFYDNLLQIDFEGVSGRVRLDPQTGTRWDDAFQYEMVNLILNRNDGDGTSSQDMLSFEARKSATIELESSTLLMDDDYDAADNDGNSNGDRQQPTTTRTQPTITIFNPFVFQDNTTIPPLALPPVEHYRNLIPSGLRAFGITLGVLVMGFSVLCATWTMISRKIYVVRAAQPFFLIFICIGTFIAAFTVILLSFQEDMSQHTLDVGCVLIPWTISLGFTVTIASLYSKARRINKVMNSGARRGKRSFRRVRIKPSDVIWPAFILLHIDLGFLVAWTFSPFRMSWQRMYVDNYDALGRQVESFGACRPADGTQWYLLFAIPLYMTKLLVLARATYASYRGRHLPTEFSETKYLIVALISLCETIVLGAIPLVAVMDHPSSFFLVSTMVIVIGCLSILLPVFVPKYWQRHAQEPKGRKAISLLQNPTIANKYTWRRPEPENTLEDAEGDSFREHRPSGRFGSSTFGSNLSSFLASEPTAIKRVSDSTASSNGTAATTTTSERLQAVGNAGYNMVKGPATVAKAILLSTFTSSSQEESTAAETAPVRLEVLLEDDDEEESTNNGAE